jgi:hypothetical protein
MILPAPLHLDKVRIADEPQPLVPALISLFRRFAVAGARWCAGFVLCFVRHLFAPTPTCLCWCGRMIGLIAK